MKKECDLGRVRVTWFKISARKSVPRPQDAGTPLLLLLQIYILLYNARTAIKDLIFSP
jgi:hypothetical protein